MKRDETTLAERMRSRLPAEYVDEYEEEVAAGEPQMALEILLDEIIDEDIPITRDLADDLQALARELGITRKAVAYLDKLVR